MTAADFGHREKAGIYSHTSADCFRYTAANSGVLMEKCLIVPVHTSSGSISKFH